MVPDSSCLRPREHRLGNECYMVDLSSPKTNSITSLQAKSTRHKKKEKRRRGQKRAAYHLDETDAAHCSRSEPKDRSHGKKNACVLKSRVETNHSVKISNNQTTANKINENKKRKSFTPGTAQDLGEFFPTAIKPSALEHTPARST